ncbi:MAG TPA: hypothetical protein VFJ14_16920 [Nocardioidaceae bacterium]|nr:hypothetical protein [Nocardioidaceae bacterium]
MTEQPKRPDRSDDAPDDEDIESAMAVNAIDDETRTHLDDPDETENVQSAQGPLEHVEPDEETDEDTD